MRRAISLFSVYLLLVATTSFPAMATSGAHFFHDTSASVDLSTGALVLTIDEGGVGQAQVNYDFNIDATSTYACINGGGNHPKAANKATFQSSTTAQAAFNPTNGRVQVTLTVSGTPLPATGFSCPSGQDLVLAAVSYTVTIVDTTNNVSSPQLTASVTFFKV